MDPYRTQFGLLGNILGDVVSLDGNRQRFASPSRERRLDRLLKVASMNDINVGFCILRQWTISCPRELRDRTRMILSGKISLGFRKGKAYCEQDPKHVEHRPHLHQRYLLARHSKTKSFHQEESQNPASIEYRA